MGFLDRIQRAYQALNGKALADLYPDLVNRQHLYSSARNNDAGAEMDSYADYARLYKSYVWVRKAVGIISQSFAPLPVRVVNAKNKSEPNHPVSLLLDQVNDSYHAADLWQSYTIHMLLGGEGPIEIVDDRRGRPAELWSRRPDRLDLVPDGTRLDYPRVLEYVVKTEDQDKGQDLRIPVSGLIHDKFYNPLSPWRGIAPVSAVRNGIVIDIYAQAWSKTFLQRGARPDYALLAPNGITPTERERYEIMLSEKFGGAEGWHRPIVLEDGVVDLKPFSWAPKDLEWIEQRNLSRDEVAAIFGVPDVLMGFGADTYDTQEKRQAAEGALWTLSIVPLVQHRDRSLQWFFTRIRPLLRSGERIATDLAGVSVLQEDLLPKLEQAGKLWAFGVPFNTLDDRLGLGIGPIPGGDVGYVSSAVIPVGSTPASGDSGAKAVMKAKRMNPRAGARKLQSIRREIADRMEPSVDQYFADLADLVVERARAHKAAKATKALPDAEDLIADGDGDTLEDIVTRHYAELLELSWETWNAMLGTDLAFDLEDPIVVEVLGMAGERIRGINDTTLQAVRALLRYGAEQGWGIDELVAGDDDHPGLRDLVTETYRNRGRTIARTELGTAQNVAAHRRYKDAGVKKVLVLDNGQEDPDDACAALNGTEQTLKWAEDHPLQHPNCTRAFGAVFDD